MSSSEVASGGATSTLPQLAGEGATSTSPEPASEGTARLSPEHIAIGCLLAFGLVARGVLVGWSPGTIDVEVWAGHAREIDRLGLVAYYRGGEFIFNHPPLAGWLVYGLHGLAESFGLPFPLLLRLPLVFVDAATAWGVVRLAGLATRPWLRSHAMLLGALCWASPLAVLYSAHHGNTDPVVACSLVWALVAFGRDRPVWMGVALGLGMWIKIPGLLAAPALFLVLPDLAARIRFCVALGATALVGFLPALVTDAAALIDAVFLYSGLRIQTTAGTPIFGPQVFYPDLASLDFEARRTFVRFANAYYRADGTLVAGLAVVYGLLRRRHRAADEVAATLAHSYGLIYAFTNFFAFQYFAWSLPLWFFAGWPMALGVHLLATLYIWGLYAWLCEHWFLLDTWRFLAKPHWPAWLLLTRNACVAALIVLGTTRIGQALAEEWRHWRGSGAKASADDEPAHADE